MKRNSTQFEQEAFEYLNDLRTSGITNMFGASPYLVEEFNIDKKEATRVLGLWMDNFNKEGDYEKINDKNTTSTSD